ncbi:transcriptional regulator, NifA subfamily, Fis Family [Solidesulfovibrio carbinoliphilus subsp. oakridgensis]|uniref:Transcriptional regulator, NifA subfamily, Fis Family n=1 Tax=Solidesulfovibrio carbinoliphilus subsp. oakridgensis TaxID=694327 RepID=G7Q7K6_9BACT|nr:sigma-54-dependent Fis family transcriptional regulator [Solidesulfovibrio carbinoliphilus]EHJ47159.1 transcriptional regulator, NifA subfamily, Fis Family [Solidesulfovibrio carbinoliphilus subsp. oakridgensis]
MAILGFVNVRKLLLELAQHQSVEVVLKIAVDTLAAASGVALVRVWLVEPGDDCARCKDSLLCPDKSRCLHLMASAGKSLSDGQDWRDIAGSAFSRFPVGIRKVGEIAKAGKPIEILDIDPNAQWVADPAWIKREKIVGFAGQPLICRDEVLGVLSVFTRQPLEQGVLEMLRMVADHLAYALANARAFEMVDRLKQQMELENAYLREEINEAQSFKGIIGQSEGIEQIRKLIRMVGPTDANVLIYGESGTGKEMIAREIHNHSGRCDKPMIKINCSAIPRELFESEFFGHARGAFTGAVKSRIGYFQAADGGTLFLDEVGEIPIYLQSKLLRVLQEGEYQRVGEETVRKVDVRIVSATNRNLHAEIQAGRFREDLYYRLQVFPVVVPSLKDRKMDVPLLTDHFIKLSCKKMNRPLVRLSEAQRRRMAAYDWPGNIRELQNFVERMVITGQPDQVLLELDHGPAAPQEAAPARPEVVVPERILTEKEMRELEKANMQAALRQTNWRIYGPRGAAKLLGVNPTTLISRLKKLGIYLPRLQAEDDPAL